MLFASKSLSVYLCVVSHRGLERPNIGTAGFGASVKTLVLLAICNWRTIMERCKCNSVREFLFQLACNEEMKGNKWEAAVRSPQLARQSRLPAWRYYKRNAVRAESGILHQLVASLESLAPGHWRTLSDWCAPSSSLALGPATAATTATSRRRSANCPPSLVM